MTTPFGICHWIRRPSLWVCMAMAVVSIYALGMAGYGSRYVPAMLAQASDSLSFITPAVGIAVAWEASRMRDLRDLGVSAVLKIGWTRFLPFLIFPVLGYVVTAVLLGRQLGVVTAVSSVFGFGAFSSTAVAMLLYIMWVGLCWIVVAAIAGMTLRPGLAIAVSVLLPYLWHGLMPAIGPGLLQSMAGNFLACCSLENVLDLDSIGVAAAGITGLVGIVGGLVLVRPTRSAAIPLVVVGILSLGVSAWIGRGLPEYGVVPRSSEDMTCREGICVRPEVPADVVEANRVARDALPVVLPAEWSAAALWPVVWDPAVTGENLSFLVSDNPEAVLGAYINQVTVGQLLSQGEPLCGVDAGIVMDPVYLRAAVTTPQTPWPVGQPISVDEASARVYTLLCPPYPVGEQMS